MMGLRSEVKLRPGIELGSIALLSPVRANTRLKEELGVCKVGLPLVHSHNIATTKHLAACPLSPPPVSPLAAPWGCCCDACVGGVLAAERAHHGSRQSCIASGTGSEVELLQAGRRRLICYTRSPWLLLIALASKQGASAACIISCAGAVG